MSPRWLALGGAALALVAVGLAVLVVTKRDDSPTALVGDECKVARPAPGRLSSWRIDHADTGRSMVWVRFVVADGDEDFQPWVYSTCVSNFAGDCDSDMSEYQTGAWVRADPPPRDLAASFGRAGDWCAGETWTARVDFWDEASAEHAPEVLDTVELVSLSDLTEDLVAAFSIDEANGVRHLKGTGGSTFLSGEYRVGSRYVITVEDPAFSELCGGILVVVVERDAVDADTCTRAEEAGTEWLDAVDVDDWVELALTGVLP